MNQLKLVGLYFKIGVLNELEYRVNFFVQIFQSGLSLLVALGGLAVVFDHTNQLNGWTSPELLTVVGVYFLIGGLINLIIQPSMQRFMEDVRQGTLDFTLVKPEDAQFLISIRQIQIWKLVDVLIGIVIMSVGLTQLGAIIGVEQGAAFGITLLAGVAIVYSFWLILATCAFWFVRIDNILVIFESMYEAGRWPVRIYPGWLQFTLTFLVPIAFAVTVPAEALTGRLGVETLLGALALAAGMFLVARLFWRFGLRHYGGASA
ncbi:MAG: ABC-2 family transporter protein [Chloroflexi bacterium]|nr:ABC-2 family transporter protein [Chloroflexota bacterium]